MILSTRISIYSIYSIYSQYRNDKSSDNALKHAYITTLPTADFTILGKDINSASQIRELYKNSDEKGRRDLIQDLYGSMDEEVTASSLSDLNGLFIGSFAARRTLAGGATATVEVNEYPEVHRLARQVAEALGARGPINIQARVHNGQLTVFEINPRFSGSAPFRAKCGFNEPHLLIQSIIHGAPVSFDPPQKNVFGVRSFKETLFQQNRKKKLVRLKH